MLNKQKNTKTKTNIQFLFALIPTLLKEQNFYVVHNVLLSSSLSFLRAFRVVRVC